MNLATHNRRTINKQHNDNLKSYCASIANRVAYQFGEITYREVLNYITANPKDNLSPYRLAAMVIQTVRQATG